MFFVQLMVFYQPVFWCTIPPHIFGVLLWTLDRPQFADSIVSVYSKPISIWALLRAKVYL